MYIRGHIRIGKKKQLFVETTVLLQIIQSCPVLVHFIISLHVDVHRHHIIYNNSKITYISEMSRDFFNKKNYIQASKYGSYAKGTAMGGIIVTLILFKLIIAQAVIYHLKYNY